jgi:hypothetical protein
MKKVPSKYEVPKWLANDVPQQLYDRWLGRKAKAHVKRDRKRDVPAAIQAYKKAIHNAVQNCQGVDAYTGEELNWKLLGKYNNEESKGGRKKYKAGFALLPSVDHAGEGESMENFKICGWRTNDAKCDLTYSEFVELCRRVVKYHEKKATT